MPERRRRYSPDAESEQDTENNGDLLLRNGIADARGHVFAR